MVESFEEQLVLYFDCLFRTGKRDHEVPIFFINDYLVWLIAVPILTDATYFSILRQIDLQCFPVISKASDLMANRMSLPLIIFRSPFRHFFATQSIQRPYILKIDFNHLRLWWKKWTSSRIPACILSHLLTELSSWFEQLMRNYKF